MGIAVGRPSPTCAYGGCDTGVKFPATTTWENMAKLTSKRRNALKASTFGLPGSRKYPMPDKSHARNALARASQQVNAGNLSSGAAARIRAKARGILG